MKVGGKSMVHVIALCLVAVAIAAPAAAEIATIKRVAGIASVQRAKTMLPAQPGTRLDAGDTLVTGKGGRIAVTFIDNARFSVGPNSRIALTRFEFDDATHKGRFETKVERGTLAVISGEIAHENPKGMTLQTPTSVLGIRGTRFVVNVK